MKKVLLTGAGGLIGSEAVRFFAGKGFDVTGLDNDMRSYFFGPDGSTKKGLSELEHTYKTFKAINLDIRDQKALEAIFRASKFDLIIHTAAQPSHDWAAREPFTDFAVNANGTLNMLEYYRRYSPEATFIFTSTNKVYGDTPNHLPLVEFEKRWEIEQGHRYQTGIDESMSIDNSLHSIFGASKVAADVMVQEYGNYFGLHTGVFRGGCLTGPSHKGVELHGFLNYLIKCVVTGKKYTIFGYKGKQVRDNIHSSDLINAFYHFYQNPKQGEVYNMGGSRHSNCSMIEAFEKAEAATGNKANYEYVNENRRGDHIWYISDVSKFRSHYPDWEYEYDIDMIIEDIAKALTDQVGN
jgi:CDP-paratose 2-epimerase